MPNCPSCGAEISATAKFCPECGEAIRQKERLCPKCQTPVPTGKFCPECGSPIEAPAEKKAPVSNKLSAADALLFGDEGGQEDDLFGTGPSESSDDSDGLFPSNELNSIRKKRRDQELMLDFEYEEYSRGKIKVTRLANDVDIEIEVPSNCVYIGDSCFEGAFVTEVTLNEGVARIGKRAFANCPYLTKVVLPKTINRIEEEAFANCPDLDFPEDVRAPIIADNAFTGTLYEKNVARRKAEEKARKAEELAKAKEALMNKLHDDAHLDEYYPKEAGQIRAFIATKKPNVDGAVNIAALNAMTPKLQKEVAAFAEKLWRIKDYEALEARRNESKKQVRALVTANYEKKEFDQIKVLFADADRAIDSASSEDLTAITEAQKKRVKTEVAKLKTADIYKNEAALREKCAQEIRALVVEKYYPAEKAAVDRVILDAVNRMEAAKDFDEMRPLCESLKKEVKVKLAPIFTCAMVDALQKEKAESKAALRALVTHQYHPAEQQRVNALFPPLEKSIDDCKDIPSVRKALSVAKSSLTDSLAKIPTAANLDALQKEKNSAKEFLRASVTARYYPEEQTKVNALFPPLFQSIDDCADIPTVRKTLVAMRSKLTERLAAIPTADSLDALRKAKEDAKASFRTLAKNRYYPAEQARVNALFPPLDKNIDDCADIAAVQRAANASRTRLGEALSSIPTADFIDALRKEKADAKVTLHALVKDRYYAAEQTRVNALFPPYEKAIDDCADIAAVRKVVTSAQPKIVEALAVIPTAGELDTLVAEKEKAKQRIRSLIAGKEYHPQERAQVESIIAASIAAIEEPDSLAEFDPVGPREYARAGQAIAAIPTRSEVDARNRATEQAKRDARATFKESDYYPDQLNQIQQALRRYDEIIDNTGSAAEITRAAPNALREFSITLRGIPNKTAVDARNAAQKQAEQLRLAKSRATQTLTHDFNAIRAGLRSEEKRMLDDRLNAESRSFEGCLTIEALNGAIERSRAALNQFAKSLKTDAQYKAEEEAARQEEANRAQRRRDLGIKVNNLCHALDTLVKKTDYRREDHAALDRIIARYKAQAQSIDDLDRFNAEEPTILAQARKEIAGILSIAALQQQENQKAIDLDRLVDQVFQRSQRGDPESMLELGDIYRDGRGVTASPIDAFIWYTKAAKKGNKTAMERLGDCYYNGYGTRQNFKEAEKWYKKATK